MLKFRRPWACAPSVCLAALLFAACGTTVVPAEPEGTSELPTFSADSSATGGQADSQADAQADSDGSPSAADVAETGGGETVDAIDVADASGVDDAADGGGATETTDAVVDADADAADATADAAADADGASADAKADTAADSQDSADSGPGPCKPTGVEACNGKDDDCDGQTDNVTCDDANPCTKDSCLGAKGCTTEVLPGPCDDSDPCTTGDSCGPAGCKGGGPTPCDDAQICTQDFCKPGEGCAHAPSFVDCSDGDACTEADACDAGACKGKPKGCDDGNACTTDTCDPIKGCVQAPSAAPCNDEDICTADDTCASGTCLGKATPCGDGNVCTIDSCDKTSGCNFKPAAGPCDDGDPCSVDDACASGGCKGAPKPCSDNLGCTLDSCSAKEGCQNTPTQGACDDGDACTSGDTCAGGTCKGTPLGGGSTASCNDGNACTNESCDKAKGCVFVPLADGQACGSNATCKAGTCAQSGNCQGGKLAGTLTLGPSGDFKTFAAALAGLAKGVCGPTTIVAAAGTYIEPNGLLLVPIPGASADARVRFQAAPGAKVRLVGVTCVSSYCGIIKFETGASWITVAGIDIDGKEPQNKIAGSYSGPIAFGSGGGHKGVRIESCHIHDFGPGAWGSSSYIGGAYIQTSGSESIEFVGNRFENLKPPSTFHTQGVIMVRNGAHAGMRIVGNTFVGNVGMATLRLRNGTNWNDLLIANNFFVQESQHALHWYSPNALTGKNQFVHNTILMSGAGAIIEGATTGAVDVRNNAAVGANNALVTTTSVGAYGANCLQGVTAPAGAKPTSPDVVGVVALLSAVAPYDLHLQPNSACLGKAIKLPEVPMDIDGQTRPDPPDIGADEIP